MCVQEGLEGVCVLGAGGGAGLERGDQQGMQGRCTPPASGDEREDLSVSWENSPKRRNQLWVSILYFLHRQKLHFTRNPSNRAPANVVVLVAIVWPGVTGLRQMGRNGVKFLALSQHPPSALSPQRGGYRSSLSLSLSPDTGEGQRPPHPGSGFWALSLPFLALGL